MTNCNILIVDDDSDDHLFLKLAMAQVIPGVFVKSCFDGSDALDYLAKSPVLPNLVFMDLNMRRMSGRTATASIRLNEKYRNLPVIILTGAINACYKNELLKLGASDFYTKPSSIKELSQIVMKVKNNWLNTLPPQA